MTKNLDFNTMPFAVTLVNVDTNEPVPYAHLVRLDALNNPTTQGTTSDWYGMASVTAGRYFVRHISYQDQIIAVVGPQVVEMVPRAYDLAEVEIFPGGDWTAPGSGGQTDGNGAGDGSGNGAGLSNAAKAGGALLLLLLFLATRDN